MKSLEIYRLRVYKDYEDEKQRQWLAQSTVTSGQFLIAGGGLTGTTWATLSATDSSFNIMPEGSVGYWAISSNTKLHRKERPNWLHQKMTKVFFGWEWKDK